ncbi:MAG: fibronectin type III domain-containing protein [Candidatus Paceibacterota bacterium]
MTRTQTHIPVYGAVLVLSLVALLFVLQPLTTQAQSVAFSESMDRGDSGNDVRRLQDFLASQPSLYPEGLVTGYYGSLTTRAVERFQCSMNIVCSGSPTTNGYGRVGPQTLSGLNGEANVSQTGGVTHDVHAPVQSVESVGTTTNSATITWGTSESSRSTVMYGLTYPFLYSSAQTAGNGFLYQTNHTVAMQGLLPNTTYYYVRESIDSAGNIMWTSPRTFRTAQ